MPKGCISHLCPVYVCSIRNATPTTDLFIPRAINMPLITHFPQCFLVPMVVGHRHTTQQVGTLAFHLYQATKLGKMCATLDILDISFIDTEGGLR